MIFLEKSYKIVYYIVGVFLKQEVMMIKLFCDMGADIPKNLVEKYGVTVFTMAISDGEKEYILGKNIDKYKLFEEMKKGVKFNTSQVSYKEYYDSFKEEILKGNEVLYISLSSGITGTYNTAVMAKNTLSEEYGSARIEVVDSLNAVFGYGSMVIKIAKFIKENKTMDEVLEFAYFLQKHIRYVFTVEDLKYLYQGGRLSKTKYLLGNLLNVCPILDMSKEDGTLRIVDKVRGHKALKKKMLQNIQNHAKDLKNQTIFVFHGDCEERAIELKEYLKTELENEDIVIYGIDAVIGCHTGPDIFAIGYLDELYGEYDKFEE